MRTKRVAVLVSAAVCVALPACGGDDDVPPPSAATVTPAPAAPAAPREPAAGDERDAQAQRAGERRASLPHEARAPRVIAAGIAAELEQRPKLGVKPAGAPPERLAVVPVGAPAADAPERGDDVTVRDGDLAVIRYTATRWSDANEFDASWNHGQLFPFVVGAPDVLKGLNEGVTGMRVGERRLVVMPPAFAYRGSNVPTEIDPDETVLSVIDLVEIKRGTTIYRPRIPDRTGASGGRSMDPDRVHRGGSNRRDES